MSNITEAVDILRNGEKALVGFRGYPLDKPRSVLSCFGYARVSTTDQDCAYQITEITEYCHRRKWKLDKMFTDAGWSGRKNNRPALLELMAAATKRKCDCVLVSKLDRFGRSAVNLCQNVLELNSKGVRFIAITQNIDTDDSHPGSMLMLNMLAAVAQFESELIRERTVAGLRYARTYGTRSGNPIGRPKRIFRRDEAIELRSAGLSFRQIAGRLNVGVGTVVRACCVPKRTSEVGLEG